MKNLSRIIRHAGFRTLSPLQSPIKMAYDVIQTSATDPNAPPLLVMHGLMGSKKNFNSACKNIHNATKRKVFNLDARNHGQSPHVDEHTAKTMAEDVEHLMKDQNIKRAAVMGHSMGGRAMMYFALKYPNLVDRAIFLDISPIAIPQQFHDMDQYFVMMSKMKVPSNLNLKQAQEFVGKKLMESFQDKSTVDFILMNLKKSKTGEYVWTVNINAIHTHFSDFMNGQQFKQPPFTGPVLFICGKHSDFLNPNDWPQIKEIFPKADLEWLDSGHLVHAEKATQFQDLVAAFLNK